MKEIAVTRKIKEALSAHFSAGGNIHNVTGELVRVSMQARQQCFEFWKEKRARK